MKRPKVFISYSWDNDIHKDWIIMLTNNLRRQGIDANCDRGITQKGTINLNRMMIENLRDNDFIIVVMTENYKERADEYKGGVGLETTFLGNYVLNNPEKIIPIKRDCGSNDKIIPYYLNGLNYTDFSQDSKFDQSFIELLHRILKVDQVKLDPIGELPQLEPKIIEYKLTNNLNGVISTVETKINNRESINKIKWIHLSDIHYNLDNYESEWVRDNLIETLKSQNERFDFLVITGDLLYQFNSTFDEVKAFLISIINTIKISLRNVFIVLGNHDFKRNSMRQLFLQGIKSSKEKIKDNVANLDDDMINVLINGQKEFWSFHEDLLGRKDNYSDVHFVNFRDKFNIVNLNTCLISGTEDEEGTLSINMKKLIKVLKSIEDNNKPNIAIGHHSLECFIPEEQDEIVKLFEDYNIDIYLCGHIHQDKYRIYTQGNRYIPSIACGSNMLDSYATASFIIGEMNLDTYECNVTYHKWSKNKQWIIDNEVNRKISDNRLTFSLERLKRRTIENTSILKTMDYSKEQIQKEKIVKKILKDNGVISNTISISSSDLEVINFLYECISINDSVKTIKNIDSFLMYISYLQKNNIYEENIVNQIINILNKYKITEKIIEFNDIELRKAFANDRYREIFLENLLYFYEMRLRSNYKDCEYYFDCERCIKNLCRYYDMFENLFGYEQRFIDNLSRAISLSGEEYDKNYAYKGLREFRNNGYKLNDELLIKLLENMDKIDLNEISLKQKITVLNEIHDENIKEYLKFTYVYCKEIEATIIPIVKVILDRYYKNFFETKCNENYIDLKNKIISRVVSKKVFKRNSSKNIKCVTIIQNYSEYTVRIHDEEEYKDLIKIIYKRNENIITVVSGTSEITSFPDDIKNIEFDFDECNRLKMLIDFQVKKITNDIDVDDIVYSITE